MGAKGICVGVEPLEVAVLLWVPVSSFFLSFVGMVLVAISVAVFSGVRIDPLDAAVLLWVPVSSLSMSVAVVILVEVGIAAFSVWAESVASRWCVFSCLCLLVCLRVVSVLVGFFVCWVGGACCTRRIVYICGCLCWRSE